MFLEGLSGEGYGMMQMIDRLAADGGRRVSARSPRTIEDGQTR